MIEFTYVTDSAGTGKRYKFKTFREAIEVAKKLVGSDPKLDPDGYAVNRITGNCLFFRGITFEALFPKT